MRGRCTGVNISCFSKEGTSLTFHNRPENISIANDPGFIVNTALPKFDLDALVASQATHKTSSQMSPLASSLGSGSSGPRGLSFEFNFHHSESPGPQDSLGLRGLTPAEKAGTMAGDERVIHIHDDVDMAGAEDWGMEIDEDGNIIEREGPVVFQDDIDLPPLPRIDKEHVAGQSTQADQPAHHDEQGDIVMMDEEPLPEAEAFQQRQETHNAFQVDVSPAQQAASRRKRKRHSIHADQETQIARADLRDWQTEYLENCGAKPMYHVTATQAKNNAVHLTFGLGIGNIGQSLGIPTMIHPLAVQFTGDALYTALTGLEVPEKLRGKRRKASEAIDDVAEEAGRRVKPRFDEDHQASQGAGFGSDDAFDLGPLGDTPPEVGREAHDPMSDHLSSALKMPWNRGSSAIPSSIRAPGSAQQGRQIPSSPLKHRGNLEDIVRYSDGNQGGIGGDDIADFPGGIASDDNSFDGLPAPDGTADTQQQNEKLRAMLDIEGHNFLSFVESAVQEHGERREDDDVKRRRKWVAFDDLFLPRETPRATAAHAFYHSLCLATKNQMYLDQDGNVGAMYGGIWLGLETPRST